MIGKKHGTMSGLLFHLFYFNTLCMFEPVPVKEFFILIIQIVQEKRFYRLISGSCLQRDLVYRPKVTVLMQNKNLTRNASVDSGPSAAVRFLLAVTN